MHVYEALTRDHPALVQKLDYLSGGVFTQRMSDFFESLAPQLLDKPVSRDALLEAIGNRPSLGQPGPNRAIRPRA